MLVTSYSFAPNYDSLNKKYLSVPVKSQVLQSNTYKNHASEKVGEYRPIH